MSQPGVPPTQKAKALGPSLKRLLARFGTHKLAMITMLIASAASVALMAVAPRMLGHGTNIIFDGVLGKQLPAGITKDEAVQGLRDSGHGQIADMVSGMDVTPGVGIDFSGLGRVLVLVLALYILSSVFQWLSSYVLNFAVQSVARRLRRDVENKIHSLPLRYFDQHSRGDLLSRVTNDIDNVSQAMAQTMSQLVSSVLSVIGILIMMVWISPLLALIAVITVPLSAVVSMQIAKRSKPHFIGQWQSTGLVNGQIEEAFTGHELVTVFGRTEEVQARFQVENEKLYGSSWKAQFISGLVMPAVMFLGNLNFVAVAVIGGLRVASGTMSLGDVQAFIQYSRQFTQPLSQIGSMVNLIQSGVASAERVFEVLDAEDESADIADAPSPAGEQGRVVFDDVSFSYDPDVPLIQHLSLVAEPGEMVAIVGPTGAGKTTLVNLLLRFYELDGGKITLDGVDIAQMSRADLRSRIGMVLQDAWVFGGTIRDNIAYGKPDATEEEIEQAARISFVDHFVHMLPDGYDTVIDEEGSNLSAGQRQLITIARAFLAKPSLLILDEATSSVDTRTELLVQQATASLRTDRTSFVIAHRLSTIREADLIVVMEHGAIVEQGSHDELLSRQGAYYRLYNSQFAGALTD